MQPSPSEEEVLAVTFPRVAEDYLGNTTILMLNRKSGPQYNTIIDHSYHMIMMIEEMSRN